MQTGDRIAAIVEGLRQFVATMENVRVSIWQRFVAENQPTKINDNTLNADKADHGSKPNDCPNMV